MEKAKILYVNQEMIPYTKETPLSLMAMQLPQFCQENGRDIRTFMPRYGTINERRNQLHEVIRLSGMNIVIGDVDHPLIIKVASLQLAKMQVYFIENDDFFHKKGLMEKNGKIFEDTDARLIFFARGVVETSLKLNWEPDLVHCNGWFSAFLPLYIRKFYKNNAMYKRAKIVFSIYKEDFPGNLGKDLMHKLQFDKLPVKELEIYEEFDYLSLIKMAVDFSDGIVFAEEGVDASLIDYVKKSGKPFLLYPGPDAFMGDCNTFYDKILS